MVNSKQKNLLQAIEDKGLSINTIAQFILDSRNRSVQDTIKEIQSNWNNTEIDEFRAGHIIANEPGLNDDKKIQILENLQNIFICLDSREYKQVINMSYSQLLKAFVDEILKMLLLEIDNDQELTPKEVIEHWSIPENNYFDDLITAWA